jgi:hypothetical protein
MATEQVINGDVRHTATATNLDFIFFKSWTAKVEREVRETTTIFFVTWEGWRHSGNAQIGSAEFQDDLGQLVLDPPVVKNEDGLHEISHSAGSAPTPVSDDMPAGRIKSMKMTYGFGKGELVEGRNWLTFIATGVVVLLALLVFGIATGFWVA